jgi:DNA repair protein RAD5
MEIHSDKFRISSIINDEPCNIELLSLNLDNAMEVIFKYEINKKTYYALYSLYTSLQKYLFFELIHKVDLWSLSYNIERVTNYSNNNIYNYNIHFSIKIEPELILSYLSKSLALNVLVSNEYICLETYNNPDLTNKSILPYNDPIQPSKENFKLLLHEYQQRNLSKMLQIEQTGGNYIIDHTYSINYKGNILNFDNIINKCVEKPSKFRIVSKGGILADEMGLGKTITSIGLIVSNPAIKQEPITNNKLNSKATLIICPSHLTKQWESEIKRCNTNMKILTILTKTDYNNLYFKDFINSDIIITSHSFLMNFNFYPSLHFKKCTASTFYFDERIQVVLNYLKQKLKEKSYEEIIELDNPIFEFFNFHRLILDEGHEILSESLNTSSVICRYIAEWLNNINGNYKWYISGTPFLNLLGVKNSAKFIDLRLIDDEKNIEFTFNNNHSKNIFEKSFNDKKYLWERILNKICIRHRKIDVEHQIKIPGYEEKLVWVKFTELENELYNSKKGKVSDEILQQLCCHPLIVESSKKIFGQNVEIDLYLMQDKLIEYHKINYEKNKVKLENLDNTKPEYYMLKKTYETHMTESKYLYTILEKMKTPDVLNEESCSICLDALTNPVLTVCGHLYCYECLKLCLNASYIKKCPNCKTDLSGKDLMLVNLKKQNREETNPLIQKYGSKLGKLISIIRQILLRDDTRIIIFSQWDDMLSLIGKSLSENEIANCFVKGNVWSRNSAIKKFKDGKNNDGDDNKVIMLSLKNAASGTNLTEATHIFFVEPINGLSEECRAIEGQAIARACRIGQTQKVLVIRILISDSIEETIYRSSYNNDVIVSYEDQEYLTLNNNVEKVIEKPIEKVVKEKKVRKPKNEIIV